MEQVNVRDVGVTTDDVGVARYGIVGDNTLKVPETDIIFTVNSDPLEELIRSKGTFCGRHAEGVRTILRMDANCDSTG